MRNNRIIGIDPDNWRKEFGDGSRWQVIDIGGRDCLVRNGDRNIWVPMNCLRKIEKNPVYGTLLEKRAALEEIAASLENIASSIKN